MGYGGMRVCSKPFKLLTEIVIVSRSRVTARALYITRRDKRHFRLSLTPFLVSSLSLFFSPCLSLTFSVLLSMKLGELGQARKINNYEARGDDSNAEIKVSSSKIILRVLYGTAIPSLSTLLFFRFLVTCRYVCPTIDCHLREIVCAKRYRI